MKLSKTILLAATTTIAVGCVSDTGKGYHHDAKHGHTHDGNTVQLMHCAIQETIPGAKATGAFLTVHKGGNEALSLVGAKAPSITPHVEIHEMVMKNGTMRMSQIQQYPLKAGNNVFKKGGYHIMLMDLKKTLTVGEKHTLTLLFSDGSKQSCTADVKSVQALTPKGMKMKHHHGG